MVYVILSILFQCKPRELKKQLLVMCHKFESTWNICAQFESAIKKSERFAALETLMAASEHSDREENCKWRNHICIIILHIHGETCLRDKEDALQNFQRLCSVVKLCNLADWVLLTAGNIVQFSLSRHLMSQGMSSIGCLWWIRTS